MAPPQICGGLAGEPQGTYESSNTADLHSLCGRPWPAEAVATEESTRCQGCIQGGWQKTVSAGPGLLPSCPNGIPHWLKPRVGWLRGGAQKTVGQTSPGEMSESTECHMCSYINRLMPLKCFPLSQQNCSMYREGKHLATLMEMLSVVQSLASFPQFIMLFCV